ncbi:MAG: DUF4105 domain-containing protein [Prevotellaceae bacterium]|jgi:hypothetical protein|nr:DUF4105 domain-containing protein [Prevotellaceae bacterium]
MNKIKLLLLSLLFFSFSAFAQSLNLSDAAKISILTCSPSEEVYAKFGHSGVRVCDVATHTDIVFNYGIFSFNTPNFIGKFIAGATDYRLGIERTTDFLLDYSLRNSQVTEQVLNLNESEKRKFIALLEENCKPENIEYRYNFVYDNCATRPRNLVMASVDGYVELINPTYEWLTFRELVAQYVGKNTWTMFGIDMIFGAESDQIASEMNAMFLPEILRNEFRESRIVNLNTDTTKPLVAAQHVLVAPTNAVDEVSKVSFPFLVFFLLLLLRLFLLYRETKDDHRKYRWFDTPFLVLTGLVGCIAFYLTFISEHPMVGENYNLLWLMPLNIVAGILLWFRSMRKLLFGYFALTEAFLLIAASIYALNVQAVNYTFMPIMLTLFIIGTSWIRRGNRLFRKAKHKKAKLLKRYAK